MGTPPLKLRQKVVNRMLIVQMLRGYFVLCSLFLLKELKRWLAKVGYERLQEYKNPELAFKRIYADYAAKLKNGYKRE